ncbi:Glycosyltransferase involved in cell wall bisynthesis [Chitinophaga sp. CF118]|uniref:glycosyltransferase family 2 protein n=1 Tax=Chitinophaga sp. CF118 TaxID=1884367 RepID=UPI0008ED6404|nr:glycosyltransferase [Chitinophaga sp. CF118]SFE26232.1 Glycosyltransferase involved in cell wall bisynthesis [Chitinophaga sp. CF118]
MTAQPLVTVFMAMYNGEKYVSDAVVSILNQSYPNFELLIIDDGSTDNSLSIIEAISDPRIRILKNESNCGLYKTRNRGIEEARGTYFAILDCDDIAYPERLSAPLTFLEQHADYVACFGKADFINGEGRMISTQNMFSGDHEWLSVLVFFLNPFINSTLVIRTDTLRKYKYREGYEPAEDYDLIQRIITDNKVIILDKNIIKYRLHQQNVSSTQAEKGKSGHKKVIRELLGRFELQNPESNIEMHYALYCKVLTNKGYNLNEIERWLLLLILQNKDRQVYPDRLFIRAVRVEWAKLIYNNKSLRNIGLFIKSPLFHARGMFHFSYLVLRGIGHRFSRFKY